jgi:hypothetical protein
VYGIDASYYIILHPCSSDALHIEPKDVMNRLGCMVYVLIEMKLISRHSPTFYVSVQRLHFLLKKGDETDRARRFCLNAVITARFTCEGKLTALQDIGIYRRAIECRRFLQRLMTNFVPFRRRAAKMLSSLVNVYTLKPLAAL